MMTTTKEVNMTKKCEVYQRLRDAFEAAYDSYEMGDENIDRAMAIADEMMKIEDHRNNLDRVED